MGIFSEALKKLNAYNNFFKEKEEIIQAKLLIKVVEKVSHNEVVFARIKIGSFTQEYGPSDDIELKVFQDVLIGPEWTGLDW